MEPHTASPATITAKVIVRHSATCSSKDQGSEYRKCRCRKSLLVYEGNGSGTNRRISAKTRSWEKAEEFKQEFLDAFDPLKMKLKRLEAERQQEKERSTVRIEEAVALYCQDMVTRLGDNATVKVARALLGHVDPETKTILKNGHLFAWLDKFNAARPQKLTYISEITPTHLTAWRASWKFGDLTAWHRWKAVRGFFKFCEIQGWTNRTDGNPALKLSSIPRDSGSRTTIFTDEQYAKILEAVSKHEPDDKAAQKRLLCFVELLRWAGMAMSDGLHYRPDMVNASGVLQYRRMKTGELATIPLPEHVISLLRDIPEANNCSKDMPFRNKTVSVRTDLQRWDRELRLLFKLAGITSVETPMGKVKKPHPHMLRDTFAVWHLRHGAQLRTVSKMLGHSETTTTERSYLPWVRELEEAHIADARRALDNGKTGKAKKPKK